MNQAVLKAEALYKSYGKLPVLKGVSLELAEAQVTALLGASGAGKSTLLQLLGLLDQADAGEIWLQDKAISSLSESARARLRGQQLGFVFQFHYLLAEFTAVENVAMPSLVAGDSRQKALARASELLHSLDMDHRLDHRPAELSGGEQQRVAVARAMMNRPRIILADEPTGNLDGLHSQELFGLLLRLANEQGTAVLLATHNEQLALQAHHRLRMVQGQLEVLA